MFPGGRKYTVGALLEEVLADKGLYEKTGGGVTFSGGESTMQNGFLAEALDACGKASVHCAIDTCGLCAPETLLGLCRNAGLVLFDLKHMDGARHKEMTGADNALILRNARMLSDEGVAIEIRVPVIPGYNDGPDNLDATAAFIGGLKSVREVVILGYHKIGEGKVSGFGTRGMCTPPDGAWRASSGGLAPPGKTYLEELRRRFQLALPDIPCKCR